jgi:hypothetical protein
MMAKKRRTEPPEVSVEIVIVPGPEGEKLAQLQAHAVRRVLEAVRAQREAGAEAAGRASKSLENDCGPTQPNPRHRE